MASGQDERTENQRVVGSCSKTKVNRRQAIHHHQISRADMSLDMELRCIITHVSSLEFLTKPAPREYGPASDFIPATAAA